MVMLAPNYTTNSALPVNPPSLTESRVRHTRNLAKYEALIARVSREIERDARKREIVLRYVVQHAACPRDLVRHQAQDYATLAAISARMLRNMEKHSKLCGVRDSLARGYVAICKEVGP